ncbi:hypothetical protein C8R46DRAFT_143968 [Mycena filopes]|nr:hypothetical protein C8R46DRAFT_143968 [Mycena filopes]
MPSLRRSSSTPSVRPAPYALLSPAAGPRVHGSGHRRSTGSETSNRRVLADIEWWKVSDGQRGDVVLEQEQELDEHDLAQDQEDDDLVPNGPGGQLGAERPATPVPWVQHNPGALEMPVAEMAALSIAPTTPRRHALESSSSSLESTPEVSDAQAEHPYLDLGALTFGLQDTEVPSSSVITRARSGTLPPLPLRAHSFADFTSHQYADFAMSPLSSPPIFSN